MRVNPEPEEVIRRFKKIAKERRAGVELPAKKLRLGVLAEDARMRIELVSERPSMGLVGQDVFPVFFERGHESGTIYLRANLERAKGVSLEDDVEDQNEIYTSINGMLKLGKNTPIHRFVFSVWLGINIDNLEIHHFNRNEFDNGVDNLICLDRASHLLVHDSIDKYDIYSNYKYSLGELRDKYPSLFLVVSYKPSFYGESLNNPHAMRLSGSFTLDDLEDAAKRPKVRDATNLKRFEPPRGYAKNMARVLRAMDRLVPLKELKVSPDKAWRRIGVILEALEEDEFGQNFSTETAERWLAALVRCRLVEKELSPGGRGTGRYRLLESAYL